MLSTWSTYIDLDKGCFQSGRSSVHTCRAYIDSIILLIITYKKPFSGKKYDPLCYVLGIYYVKFLHKNCSISKSNGGMMSPRHKFITLFLSPSAKIIVWLLDQKMFCGTPLFTRCTLAKTFNWLKVRYKLHNDTIFHWEIWNRGDWKKNI